MTDCAYEVKLNQYSYVDIERVTSALKASGFGVLTRINVRATLKETWCGFSPVCDLERLQSTSGAPRALTATPGRTDASP